MLFGNGASAAISSHVAVDLTKTAGIQAVAYNDCDLITCLSNDYGYEYWVEKTIEWYGNKDDVAVLISSSGKSQNIINGAKTAKNKGLHIVTLSGMDEDNPLRKLGDINFYVRSSAYNHIETIHQLYLSSLVDLIVGKS